MKSLYRSNPHCGAIQVNPHCGAIQVNPQNLGSLDRQVARILIPSTKNDLISNLWTTATFYGSLLFYESYQVSRLQGEKISAIEIQKNMSKEEIAGNLFGSYLASALLNYYIRQNIISK